LLWVLKKGVIMSGKFNFYGVFTGFFMVIAVISGCRQLGEMKNLSKCQFRLKNIQIQSVDNVDVSNVKTMNDLNVTTIAKLGSSLLTGKLPLTFQTNIESKNPNNQNAAINKFDLHILFNNVDLVQTVVNQRVEILPGQTIVIPVVLTSDIAQIVKGENIRTVLGWIFPGNDTPAVFTIKIKPSILVGPVTLSYPGFITLSKDFKTQ